MFKDLLIFMLGGAVGFFAAALCKSASRADEQMEKLQMASQATRTVDDIIGMEAMDSSEENIEE